MAIIRKKELEGMQESSLNEKLNDLKMELLRMNAKKSAKSSIKIRETKKTIARILTLLRQKSISKTNKEKK